MPDRLPNLQGDLLAAGCAGLRVDRIDQEALVLPVHPRVHPADEPVTPEDGEDIGPEFSFVWRQVVFMDIVEAEHSVHSVLAGDQIVEGSQQGHPRLPRVRVHRFKERYVQIMDISFTFAGEPGDLNPTDCRFLLQMFQGLFQVQIATAQKIDVDLGRGRGAEGSDRLSAPARSASCSVSSFLSAQLGRNVSGRPQIFWFPWWPTTMTSPRICRWKSAAETSLPEVHPSALRLVGTYSSNSVSRKGPLFS